MSNYTESECRIALKEWKDKYSGKDIQFISEWERTRNFVLAIGGMFDDD